MELYLILISEQGIVEVLLDKTGLLKELEVEVIDFEAECYV